MADTDQLLRHSYTSGLDDTERDAFVYLPRGYRENPDRQWPVMLFLHGNGERGNGREELGHVLAHGPLFEAWIQRRELPFIIISPQLPMFGMDETVDYLAERDPEAMPRRLDSGTPPRGEHFPTPEPMGGKPPANMDEQDPLLPHGWDQVEDDLLHLLDEVLEQRRADPARVYLTGLSYGGFGTWYLASHHPQRFAAIAPVVGWGHPELMAPIARAQLPVWAFAGGRDTAVAIEHFYAGLNQLESLGHPSVRFTNHEDMGHDAWRRVYRSGDLYQWLMTHQRQP